MGQLIRRNIPTILASLIGVGLLILAFASCNGPNPHVVEFSQQPTPQAAQHPGENPSYKVTFTIENQGRGDGQTKLVVKLVDKQSGHTVAEQQQLVELGDRETEEVDVTFPDVPQGEYTVSYELHYPPD